jgi:hypothetical protein
MDTPNHLPDFKKLSDSILYYRPQFSPTESATPPSLIILCTWVGAQPKHISRYTETYKQQYQNASILVIHAPLPYMVLTSDRLQQSRLKIAIDIICNDDNGFLLHAFSNGGAVTATQLLNALPLAHRQSLSALVLDSCPGQATYQRTAKAILISLPKIPFIRFTGAIVIYIFLLIMLGVTKMGVENAISKARRRLNDETLLGSGIPRLYIYSKEDEMVWYSDVHDHAEEAKAKGYKSVSELMFEDSSHCAHVRAHEEKYWSEVSSVIKVLPRL